MPESLVKLTKRRIRSGTLPHLLSLIKHRLSCRKTLRCLHHRLRKISLQDLKRRIAVQTAVRLHSVIEINKAAQLLSPVFRTVKQLFLMSHLHQGSDRSVYFPAQDIEPVQKAYNYLTGRDFVLKGGYCIGQIVALKKEPDSNSGKVTINTFVQGKPKKYLLLFLEMTMNKQLMHIRQAKGPMFSV